MGVKRIRKTKNIEFIGENTMNGNIYTVGSLIDGIKDSPSLEPELMPLRQKRPPYPDWVDKLDARLINELHWSALRKVFINKLFFGHSGNEPGLYFFHSSLNEKYPFYYIGTSKKGNSYNVKNRVSEHLLEKDYYFYMLAYPNNKLKYYKEAERFYFAPGEKYANKINEYARQYHALDKVSAVSSVAWITNSNFNENDWDAVESFFVTTYKPPANGAKKSEPLEFPPLSNYKSKFEEAENYLFNIIIPQLRVEVNDRTIRR